MSNTWSPAATSNEGEVLNLSRTSKGRQANLSSSEEGGSSSPQSNDSTTKSTRQPRGRWIVWTEAARLGLMQQVQREKPYLMGHELRGKAWENVASALSTVSPFAEAGGITAEACAQTYAAMVKDHEEKEAKGECEAGKGQGECEAVRFLPNKCNSGEQEMLEGSGKTQGESEGKENKKEEARAEKLLEASVAPAGSPSRIAGRRESRETSDEKPTSLSPSPYSSLESAMAGYLASLADSPNRKRRKQEVEFLEAKRRQEITKMVRRIVASKEECPVAKRRRKDIEASDAAARLRRAQNRRIELEQREQRAKATKVLQEGTLELIATLMEKFSEDP